MKTLIKRTISLILTSFMLTQNVFALTTNLPNHTSSQIGIKDEFTAEKETDNTDIAIQVIRKSRDNETLIYTGPLSGYENANLRASDFSKIEFLAIFDWDAPEPEILYIIPTNKATRSQNNLMTAEEMLTLMGGARATASNTEFDFDATFWNNNSYNEYIAEKNNILGVDLRIKNTSKSTQTIQPYFALYENGKLIQAKMLSSKTVSSGNEVNYTESININGNNTKIIQPSFLIGQVATLNHLVKL